MSNHKRYAARCPYNGQHIHMIVTALYNTRHTVFKYSDQISVPYINESECYTMYEEYGYTNNITICGGHKPQVPGYLQKGRPVALLLGLGPDTCICYV